MAAGANNDNTPYLFSLSKNSVADSSIGDWMTGKQSAPGLFPPGATTPDEATRKQHLVDVVRDFRWTGSPKEQRILDETPEILFNEYYVVGNAIQQQAKYMLDFGTSNALMGAAVGGVIGAKLGGWPGAAIGGGIGAVAGGAMGGVPGARKGYLEPYADLYAIKPSGFKYRLPFFEEQYRSILTQWGSPAAAGAGGNKDTLTSAYSKVRNIGNNITNDAAALTNEPNAFIEESKQYQHTGDASPFNLKLFLSNTGKFTDIIRNWHLIYMLTYQNLPNRSSKVLIRPPVIYEVEIPGVMYHPFCSIASLDIKYKGAMRKMKIPVNVLEGFPSARTVGGGGIIRRDNMSTSIPDGYEIDMQIMPLVKETQNFLYHTTTENESVYDIKIRE